MNTRKALAKLSGGDKVYTDHAAGLYKQGQKFIDMYDAREREIIAKKNADSVPVPFLDMIRKKVSKMVDAPDADMPLIARYDIHAGISKLAGRVPNDQGLRRLATQLERAWHSDPLGALSYGDVDGMVKLYRDQYPRSKAADAIEAECARAGLHKLPVAKLARIAANITTQEDYDSAMAVNGYGGSRSDQIRARTLVRELVNMRGNKIASAGGHKTDTRPATERIADGIVRRASMEKEAGYQEAMQSLEAASELSTKMKMLLDQASKNFNEDGFSNPADVSFKLGDSVDALTAQLTDLRDNERMVTDSEVSVPAGEQKKFDTQKSQNTKDMSQSMQQLDMSLDPTNSVNDEAAKLELEQGIAKNDQDAAGLGKRKWYDPRTWHAKAEKIAAIVKAASEIAANTDGEFSSAMFAFAKDMRKYGRRIAQLAPQLEAPIEDPEHEMLESPAVEELEQEMGVEMAPPGGPEELSPENVDQGLQVLDEIEDAAEEIIVEAPPEAVGYIQHEMAEGHGAPPGTAEWGAEEILNEGHEAPPPTDEWLTEELEEINHGGFGSEEPELEPEMPMMASRKAQQLPKVVTCPGCDTIQRPGRPCPVCKYPDPARANITPENPAGDPREWAQGGPVEPVRRLDAAKGKGIPVPDGKIKSQPNSKSLVKAPENGAKALKAEQIESAILDGNVVKSKTGGVKIFINANDEVELWHKNSGRVCDVIDMDVAIADFINMARHERVAAHKHADLVDVVDVPCADCANITTFKHSASADDQYVCKCGHATETGTIDALVKLGHLAIRKVAQYQYNTKQYADMAMSIASKAKTTQDMYKMVMDMSEKNKGVDPDVLKNKTLQVMQSMKSKQTQSAKPPATPGIPSAPAQVTDDQITPLDPPPLPVVAQLQSPPPAAPPAAPAPGGDEPAEEPVTDMPVDQVVSSAFVNYKAQNMTLPEALRTFFKEHQDLVDSKWGPDADAALVAAQTQYYTANAPGGVTQVPMQPAVPGMDAGAPAPEAPAPVAPAPAAKQGQKVMTPAISKKNKDSVSVGSKPLGKDMEGKDVLPSPGKIKVQQGKPDGKLSPTELGEDSDSKDIALATPKGKPTKGKLPSTDMGKDSEPNEPFKSPALGK